MRHLRQIRNERFAGRVLAQIERYLHVPRLAAGQLHHVLDADPFLFAVWHLDAYSMLARKGSDNPDSTGGQRASHIIGKCGYLTDLDTGGELKLEHGDNRPSVGGYHLRIYTELRQQRLQVGRL